MSKIKYQNKTYGASPFAFFRNKAAAEAARQAGQILPGQVVITLDDTIGQMMAASVGYDNTESGLEAETVQGAIDEAKNEIDDIRGIHNNASARAYLKGDCIELKGYPSPYIDFHYNASETDYTSRIIEIASGIILCEQLFAAKEVTTSPDDCPYGISSISELVTNSPFTFWSTILTIGNVQRNYMQQIAFPWAGGETRIAYRVKDLGTWQAWKYIQMA